MARYNRVTFTGGSDTIAVTFPYLSKEHIEVTVGGTVLLSSEYEWSNDTTIRVLGGNPAAGVVGEVRGVTPDTELVDFSYAALDPEDLNTANKQALYVAAEAKDLNADTLDKVDYLYGAVEGDLSDLQQASAVAQAAKTSAENASASAGVYASQAQQSAGSASSSAIEAGASAANSLSYAGASQTAANTASTLVAEATQLLQDATAGFAGFTDGLGYDFGSITSATTYFNQDWGTL